MLSTKVRRTCVNAGMNIKLYYRCLTMELSNVLRVNAEHSRLRVGTKTKAIISDSFSTPIQYKLSHVYFAPKRLEFSQRQIVDAPQE